MASAAFDRLDHRDDEGFAALLDPTVPLARHLFGEPTYDYKTGVVFLAYLNGHQPGFGMLGGLEAGVECIGRDVATACSSESIPPRRFAMTSRDCLN
ncbi:DUF993 family protein [Spirillospora sp. CA-255316]